MSQKKRAHWPLALVLLAYLVITVGYGVVNPLFEAPDENWHYFTAQTIADTGQLPVVEEDYDLFLSQEAAQPPLYYLLGAVLTGWIDTSQAREEVWPNPWAWAGDAAALANYNQFVHTDREAWPWQGYVLAAHLLRLFSTLLGLGTLICVYGCANLIFRTEIGTVGTPRSDEHGLKTNLRSSATSVNYPLLATAIVAFWPQFNFVHASVTNDALITFLCAAALWQLLKLWQLLGTHGNSEELRGTPNSKLETRNSKLSPQSSALNPRYLLLGVTIAAAVLTKNAGTLLFLYALGFVTVLVWRRGEKWGWVAAALLIMLPVLLLSSWLWWRNWSLYGDPTAANVFVRLAGGDRNYTLWQVLAETPSLWTSLFALFGWFNVRAPDWVFWLWNGLVVIAVLGWLVRLVSSYPVAVSSQQSAVKPRLLTVHCSLLTLLLAWVLLIYAGLVSFMLRTPAAQGRLLFPALVPLVLGLVAGLKGWELVGTRRNSGELGGTQSAVNSKQSPVTSDQLSVTGLSVSQSLIRFIPLLPLLTTLYCLLVVIPSAYARPRTVTALPTNVPVLQQEMSEGVFLVGGQIETAMAQPGDPVWLTLYWQAQTAPLRPTAQVVELFGPDLTEPLARLHSYHGRGMFPMTLWPVGVIWEDRFALRLNETIDAPVLAQMYVRLAQQAEGVALGAVKVIPLSWPPAPEMVLVRLGEGIELRQMEFTPSVVAPGETITVTVLWTVAAAPQTAYTTFIHLGDPAQVPLAVGDDQPRQGWYPTTVWQAGEVIPDQYTITVPTDLPPGDYPLVMGMYDAAANTRLPLTRDGQPQPYDAFFVGEIRVISNQ